MDNQVILEKVARYKRACGAMSGMLVGEALAQQARGFSRFSSDTVFANLSSRREPGPGVAQAVLVASALIRSGGRYSADSVAEAVGQASSDGGVVVPPLDAVGAVPLFGLAERMESASAAMWPGRMDAMGLLRAVPIGVAYAGERELAYTWAERDARLTHVPAVCGAAAGAVAYAVACSVNGEDASAVKHLTLSFLRERSDGDQAARAVAEVLDCVCDWRVRKSWPQVPEVLAVLREAFAVGGTDPFGHSIAAHDWREALAATVGHAWSTFGQDGPRVAASALAGALVCSARGDGVLFDWVHAVRCGYAAVADFSQLLANTSGSPLPAEAVR